MTKRLRCRASVMRDGDFHSRQCTHPAKGEREVRGYTVDHAMTRSYPFCGIHLNTRYVPSVYTYGGSNYDQPVQEFMR